MVTPHLPPHQAANALLPHLLGEGLRGAGHEVAFLTFASGAGVRHDVATVRRRRAFRATRLPQVLEAAETWWKARALIDAADVVHVHSSTWMNQVAARVAVRHRRPYVLTHYGTEIWHHDGKDLRFRRFHAGAARVAFYSEALLARARELGLGVRAATVVYPPVADTFRPLTEDERRAVRTAWAVPEGPLVLNVKRLHPLADQATLLQAMAEARRSRPDLTLLVAGAGEEQARLEARVRALGLERSVRLLGLVPNQEVARLQAAADLFVLSSVLEATPTVALEALACGTPVVSTDNPGGLELRGLFGEDVAVVTRGNASALADAMLAALAAPRRASDTSLALVAQRFRLPAVTARYLDLYREARPS
jgi:glycosyltransferase involved in cell wall biosynthesis